VIIRNVNHFFVILLRMEHIVFLSNRFIVRYEGSSKSFRTFFNFIY